MYELADGWAIVCNRHISTLHIHISLGEEETNETPVVRVQDKLIWNASMVAVRGKWVYVARENIIRLRAGKRAYKAGLAVVGKSKVLSVMRVPPASRDVLTIHHRGLNRCLSGLEISPIEIGIL